MKKSFVLVFLGLVAAVIIGRPAQAVPLFKKKFDEKYVKDSSDQKFKDAAKEANCGICHDAKDKKLRNDYGKALSELLKKDQFKAAREKAQPDVVKKEIFDAFEKVESKKSEKGKTFGELIKAGELPGSFPAK